MIRSTILLGLLAAVPALAQETAKSSQDAVSTRRDQVDKIFAQWDSTLSPGCALSVMKDGQIVYQRGYGMADLDHDVPITAQSIFHVASISKQFTAAAIILLAQDGKLSLDDDVHKYIKELPDFGAPITIRHLIHHTSGLRDQWALLGLAGWRYSLDLITDDDVMELISRQKELNFKPGEKHVYCNTGYTLLAQIVKRVSGQSFREFTTSRIFEPLGMNSTHFRDDHAEMVKHMFRHPVVKQSGVARNLHGHLVSRPHPLDQLPQIFQLPRRYSVVAVGSGSAGTYCSSSTNNGTARTEFVALKESGLETPPYRIVTQSRNRVGSSDSQS